MTSRGNNTGERWQQIADAQSQGRGLAPRCYHTLTECGEHGILLFGGCTEKAPRGTKHMWLLRNHEWVQLSINNMTNTQKRYKHFSWYHAERDLFCV
jgi:hypothetical protein